MKCCYGTTDISRYVIHDLPGQRLSYVAHSNWSYPHDVKLRNHLTDSNPQSSRTEKTRNLQDAQRSQTAPADLDTRPKHSLPHQYPQRTRSHFPRVQDVLSQMPRPSCSMTRQVWTNHLGQGPHQSTTNTPRRSHLPKWLPHSFTLGHHNTGLDRKVRKDGNSVIENGQSHQRVKKEIHEQLSLKSSWL